jgi:hypothetical protein
MGRILATSNRNLPNLLTALANLAVESVRLVVMIPMTPKERAEVESLKDKFARCVHPVACDDGHAFGEILEWVRARSDAEPTNQKQRTQKSNALALEAEVNNAVDGVFRGEFVVAVCHKGRSR